jgi:hypothetical protein
MDWPDMADYATARRALCSPEAIGDHSGDCTGEIHTCMRCERDRMLKMAEAAIRAASDFVPPGEFVLKP